MFSSDDERSVSALRRRDDGNVAAIFAITLIPLMAAVGAGLDYARASKAQTQLRDAVDSAALAAVQKMGGSYDDRQQAALGALQANLATTPIDSLNVTVTDVNTAAGKGVQVDADGLMTTSFMRLVGVSTMTLGAHAEALAGVAGNAEIALVLDNTGSMINDMPALKAAASNFVNTVFASGSANVKMSVVPYVAAVNVGTDFPPSALDYTGTAPFHASIYRGMWISSLYNNGCDPWVNSTSSGTTTSTGTTTPTDPGTPIGQDKTGALDPARAPDLSPFGEKARSFARSLFGVSRAAAQAVVTPNSYDPIITTPYTVSPPYVPTAVTVQVPAGYTATTICWLANPGVISNFDLFNRMPGASWKGCIEARPDPYDVNDDPPNPATLASMFVPYFAPDERDQPVGSPQFDNNYLNDTHASWVGQSTNLGWATFDGFTNIMKYDGVNAPSLVEWPPATKGPNFACPDPLLRLTNVKADVLSKINSLNYWSGGGTVTSEGLAWGWRTISPNPPFAQGSAYGATKKYIVLMTDGMNSLVANRPAGSNDLLSEYTAYGFLTQGRFMSAPFTFPGAENFLNTRMSQVCENAKAKKISIFTILFRETDPTITNLLASCASSPTQALKASDAASLNAAFSNIASQVNTLRLSK